MYNGPFDEGEQDPLLAHNAAQARRRWRVSIALVCVPGTLVTLLLVLKEFGLIHTKKQLQNTDGQHLVIQNNSTTVSLKNGVVIVGEYCYPVASCNTTIEIAPPDVVPGGSLYAVTEGPWGAKPQMIELSYSAYDGTQSLGNIIITIDSSNNAKPISVASNVDGMDVQVTQPGLNETCAQATITFLPENSKKLANELIPENKVPANSKELANTFIPEPHPPEPSAGARLAAAVTSFNLFAAPAISAANNTAVSTYVKPQYPDFMYSTLMTMMAAGIMGVAILAILYFAVRGLLGHNSTQSPKTSRIFKV